MNENDLKRNGSGYFDPTAYNAIKNVEGVNEPDADDERFHKLLKTIFDICELSDFHVEERIIIKDKRTGKVYR